MYRILLDRRAEKEFGRLPGSIRKRFYRAFEQLERDPRSPRAGCDIRLLSARGADWRLRVGDYRAIYRIDDDSKRVLVTALAPRGGAYSG